jgi:hypothetical protein
VGIAVLSSIDRIDDVNGAKGRPTNHYPISVGVKWFPISVRGSELYIALLVFPSISFLLGLIFTSTIIYGSFCKSNVKTYDKINLAYEFGI